MTAEGLMQLFETRYSGRAYDSAKDVSESDIKRLMQAAHLTPSCYNEQPWHFIIAHKKRQEEGYKKIFASLVEFNQGWAKEAPVLLVSVASLKYRKNGKPNRHGPYDTGAAAFAIMLEATTMGLMAHQMGGFDEMRISESFAIPASYTPMAVMALGYERKGEPFLEKDRRPLPDHFYMGEWKH